MALDKRKLVGLLGVGVVYMSWTAEVNAKLGGKSEGKRVREEQGKAKRGAQKCEMAAATHTLRQTNSTHSC